MSFPSPVNSASLVLSFRLGNRTTLIIGSGRLAAVRTFAALEADSSVVVLATSGDGICDELKYRAEQSQIILIEDWDENLEPWLTGDVSMVCITDTVAGSSDRRSSTSVEKIYRACRARNILVNTTDMPEFCDFSFTSTHRFDNGPLQIGVTTNGQGCRLAGRIKRDIVAKLPNHIGLAVQNVGKLRSIAKLSNEIEDSFDDETSSPNRPVPQRTDQKESAAEESRRRIKWVAQVSEYWPMSKLAGLTELDITQILTGEVPSPTSASNGILSPSIHDIPLPRVGRIILAGSGPGHPALLTVAARTALTDKVDLVLSDKLVPEAVLALIPNSVGVRIAKKFPGNAEGAQTEMMEAAVEAAKKGFTVLRLKQGDPAVYGRLGEEILYFRSHGFEPVVIPGVSSALAAPLFAGIPITQRGVAESFVVCTGVGRGGKQVKLPGYERSQTLVLLMGVARLQQVVQTLIDPEVEKDKRNGQAFPKHLPIAIVERGSLPDQRVITSTLSDIVQALDSVGDQRPPGMLVIGWAVLSLWEAGDVKVLDSETETDDLERVQRWLRGERWRAQEGLPDDWGSFYS